MTEVASRADRPIKPSYEGTKPSYTEPEEGLEFGRILGLMIDARWALLAITVLSGLSAYFWATVQPPVYEGDSLIQVERRTAVNPLEEINQTLAVGGGETAAEVQIIQSRMILGSAVDLLDLQTLWTPEPFGIFGNYFQRANVRRPSWAKGGASVWGGESLEVSSFSVAENLYGQTFRLVAGTGDRYALWQGDTRLGEGRVGLPIALLDGAISLKVSRLEGEAGASWALRRVSRLTAIRMLQGRLTVATVGGGRSGGTGMIRLSLQGPDRELIRKTLDGIGDRFMRQNMLRQAEQADRSLAFLNEQAPLLRAELTAAEKAFNDFRVNNDSVDLSSEASTTLQALVTVEGQLNELEYEEAEVAQLFMESHPQYQALKRRRQFLEGQRQQLLSEVNALPASQQEVLSLSRDVQVAQEIYVTLLNRMQELELARAGTVGNVRVIDPAAVPPAAVAPKRGQITLLAAVGGLLLTAIGVYLRGLFQRGVEVPEQLEELGISVFATIPKSAALAPRRTAQRSLWAQMKAGFRPSARKTRREQRRRLLTDPTDNALEALRGFRTSLHFALIEGDHKIIAISGSSPGVGKTFVSANLAAVCASSGQRVAIVDVDMRRGHIHTMFQASRTPGLSEYLAGDAPLEAVLRESSVSGVFLIPRGVVPPNPSELLMGAGFKRLLEALREQFDLVILDTPPVLPVTDGAVAASASDGVFLVAKFSETSVKDMELSRARLEKAGAVVRGAVLNQIERKASSYYGYYGYYNYQYNYQYQSKVDNP